MTMLDRRRVSVGLSLLILIGAAAAQDASTTAPTTATAPAAPVPRRFRRPDRFDKAAIIPIEDQQMIDEVTVESIERRIDEALDSGADLIVLELDTYGGMTSAGYEISSRIKRVTDAYTVAWIRPRAISAGSMIAVACDEIVVSRGCRIGDCQQIVITPEGPKPVPEELNAKFNSPLYTEFEDSARKNGYDPLLCMAMVRPELEVFWVRNTATGESRFANRQQRDALFGIGTTTAPVKIEERVPKTETDPYGAPKVRYDTRTTYKPGEFVDDSASRTDWRYVRSHAMLHSVDQPIDAHDRLLTMTEEQAIAYGFAEILADDETALRERLRIAGPIERIDYSWSESMVQWLSSPIVRGILAFLIFTGVYVEFKTPGVGLAGLVALIALAVFLGAPYLTGMAQWWEIALVAVGFVLLGLEIFVIPGFGVAGIAGIVLILAGLLMTFAPPEPGPIIVPHLDFTRNLLFGGVRVMGVAMLCSVVGAVILARYLPAVPVLGRVIAPNPTPEQVAPDVVQPQVAAVGSEGVALGALRPAGKARFGDELVDVVADGEFIGKGDPIVVIARHANRVVVRRGDGGTE